MSLSVCQKIYLITRVEDKMSPSLLAAQFNVDHTTIQKIYDSRAKIFATCVSGIPLNYHCAQRGRVEVVDKALYEWFFRRRQAGRKKAPISLPALQETALLLARRHRVGGRFVASRGFISRWQLRHAVRRVHLHGEAESVDMAEAQGRMDEILSQLAGVARERIISMNQAALLYQLVPSHSYVTEKEARAVRGTKDERSKARLTMNVCVNAIGTFRFISLIGKAAVPVCFLCRGRELPMPYHSRAKAWMHGEVFSQHWFKDFVDRVKRFTSEKVNLVLDNASGHSFDSPDPQVFIVGLPRNTTARFQPCDAGIIKMIQSRYR